MVDLVAVVLTPELAERGLSARATLVDLVAAGVTRLRVAAARVASVTTVQATAATATAALGFPARSQALRYFTQVAAAVLTTIQPQGQVEMVGVAVVLAAEPGQPELRTLVVAVVVAVTPLALVARAALV